MSGLLSDVRILDLSHLLPGQFATALLAQLGAEVITVERPGDGDYLRQFPATFVTYNHSKESIALDLSTADGQDAFLDLARGADAVVEEFRPGVVTRLGVDYQSVSAVNEEIVYCSISGYGQEGPRADEVGHDVNYSSLSGIVDQTGQRGGPPVIPGVPVADMQTAALAALSISAALHGEGGEYIDFSMADAALNAASVHLAEFVGRGTEPGRGDTGITGGFPCYSLYQCADGEYLAVGAIEPHFWERLCEAMDLTEYAEEQWVRGERREEMFATFSDRFMERPREEWLAGFDRSSIPVSPVNSLSDVVDEPQFEHRDAFRPVSPPDGGDETAVVGFPAVFRNRKLAVSDPPALGGATRRLLEECGYDDAAIEELLAAGVAEEADDGP